MYVCCCATAAASGSSAALGGLIPQKLRRVDCGMGARPRARVHGPTSHKFRGVADAWPSGITVSGQVAIVERPKNLGMPAGGYNLLDGGWLSREPPQLGSDEWWDWFLVACRKPNPYKQPSLEWQLWWMGRTS